MIKTRSSLSSCQPETFQDAIRNRISESCTNSGLLVSQVQADMQDHGIEPPDQIVFDGKIHRFSTNEKYEDTAGWYVLFADGIPAGAYGDFRADISCKWRADIERVSSGNELEQIRDKQAKALQIREQAYRKAAVKAKKIWDAANPYPKDHPYLQIKGIKPHIARLASDGRLLLPVYGKDGNIISLQHIDNHGKKQFLKDGKTGGGYCILGELENPGKAFMAEGFATAASIFETTGTPTIVAFNSGNMIKVSKLFKQLYPHLEQIFIADNDASGAGEKAAQTAAEATGAKVILIPEPGMDANDYAQAGKDLKALLLAATSKIEKAVIKPEDIEEAFKKTLNLSWIIKDIIPESSGLSMIYGPPGTYKSFIAIDMALCMANGIGWHGKRIKQRNVLYIAAEGQAGILKRMEAWRQHHEIKRLKNIAILPMPARLDDDKELQDLKRAIRNLTPRPQFVFFDTLARSMDGEENSKTGMSLVVNAIDAIKQEFGIQVLVVHHSGKDPSKGARGSNSLEGATDTQFVVKKVADYEAVMECERQKDEELSEPIGFRLEKVDTGYKNVDEDPVTSLVPVMDVEVKPKNSAEKKKIEDMNYFERAWFDSGAEDIDGSPYLTRSAWANWLYENGISNSENAAKNAVKASANGIAKRLIEKGLIENYQSGYTVTDEVWRYSLMVKKGNRLKVEKVENTNSTFLRKAKAIQVEKVENPRVLPILPGLMPGESTRYRIRQAGKIR